MNARQLFVPVLVAAALALPSSPEGQGCCPGRYFAGQLIVFFPESITPLEAAATAQRAGARLLGGTSGQFLMEVPFGEEDAFLLRFQMLGASHVQHNGAGCTSETGPCTCCPCGLVCPTVPSCPECAGAVPDGTIVSGLPLSLEHVAGGDVRLSWGDSCVSDDDYAVYEGVIGDFASHRPLVCSTSGEMDLTLTPSTGSVYYLVVPRHGAGEGSYGVDSLRLQRQRSATPCGPSAIAVATGCHVLCGDGVRGGAEQCDSADLGERSCLTEGFDAGALACSPSCVVDTTACISNCGDGVRQDDESCDGTDLGDRTCQDFGFTGGELVCRPQCMFSFASCTLCGNNAREGAEICDGTDLAGQTCVSQGFTGGPLGCNVSCSDFNRSACTRCGNGVREGGEVCDGSDLGGKSCESLGFSGGTLRCSASCLAFDVSMCFS